MISIWESTPSLIQFIYITEDSNFPQSSIFCIWSPFILPNFNYFFYPLTKQLFVSMCITAGKLTRKLPYQHRADTHSYYHFCSQTSQEPEEESLGCCFGHSTGVFWNQHGTEEITGLNIYYVNTFIQLTLWCLVLHIARMFLCCHPNSTGDVYQDSRKEE